MKRSINYFILFILIIYIPNNLSAQKTAANNRLVKPDAIDSLLPLDTTVRTGKLLNGFTYYILHNEEPKNRVVFYLANKVGSVLETDQQRGLAHFIEHMSFNGTQHFPKNSLVDYLQKAGVRFGADINAYTSFDETVYELPLPADNLAILNNGIEIMHDWAHGATLDSLEIDKERGVILEEKRLRKGAEERFQEQYLPVIYNNSRYSKRLPIGTDDVLNSFKADTLRQFYKDWYRPNLQALLIVGDIDVDKMEKLIKAKFSDLKNPENERERVNYTVTLSGESHFAALTDKESTTNKALLLYKHDYHPVKTKNDYHNQIIIDLFNRMVDERLWEFSNRDNPPFVRAAIAIQNLTGQVNALNASFEFKPNKIEEGFKACYREMLRMKRFGFLPVELERAKAAYISKKETSLQELDKTNSAKLLRQYLKNFLSGEAAPGLRSEVAMDKEFLPGITLSDINSVLRSYLVDLNRDILFMTSESEKANLPDKLKTLRWISALEAEKLTPYTEDPSGKSLLSIAPKPGKIVSQTTDSSLNVTKITLSNGAKVLLKPTNFKNDEILISAFAPGGTSLTNDSNYESAAYSASVIIASGIGNYTAIQLEKYLSGKQLSVYPYITENSQGISAKTTAKDIATALQIVNGYFTQPRKDSLLFHTFVEREKTKVINSANDPGKVYQDSSSIILYNGNIRRTGSSLEKLALINLDQSYRIYKERFADAANFTFVFVGAFKIDAISPLIEKYIASLPATHTYEKFKDLNIHIPSGVIEKTFYKGAANKAAVNLIWSGSYEFSQHNNIMLNALKEVLQVRLLERLREEESGVYSPSTIVLTNKVPQSRYAINVAFTCGPENVEKLVASVQDEINKLKAQGPSSVNLDKFKVEDQRNREIAMKSNNWWRIYLDTQCQNTEDIHAISSYTTDINKVVPEMVKAAANQYLSGINYIRLIRMPGAQN